MATRLDERFFAGMRGQVVTLLRRAGRTVEDPAEALLTEVVGVPVRDRCDRQERPLSAVSRWCWTKAWVVVPVGSEGGGSYEEGQAHRAKVLMEVRWAISR